MNKVQRRASQLFAEHSKSVLVQTDRLFAALLAVEWISAVAVALWISPTAWAGTESSTHPHVWAAIFLGAIIISLPITLALTRPGQLMTRHSIAISQMLFGALLIHLTGGRIESHFHIFGSLAFLAFYRDWRVLITASVVVAIDHLFRGLFWPQSVYGVLSASTWRTGEHVFWVVFEDIFLIRSCLQNVAEMRQIATRQAELEHVMENVEEIVIARTAELKLSENKSQQLARIVECSGDAIYAINLDLEIISWNRGAERLFGYLADEVIGKPVNMLLPDDRIDEISGQASDVKLGVSVEGYETVRRKEDGSFINVSVGLSPIYEDGQIVGMSAIDRDITERKTAEKRVSEFYSTVSHELRTPLTAIRGAMGLIEAGIVEAGSDGAMELIQIARASSDRLIRLINDILDLRKIEAGKFDLKLDCASSEQLMRGAISSLTGMAEEAGVKLRLEPVTAATNVYVDIDRCTQVLTNLIANAIKFSHSGAAVTVQSNLVGADRVRFSVIDSGDGISKPDMDKLFQKFQQLDSSDTRKAGGTGLGLAISKALVEQHGGKIGVTSCPGHGSTFWFELPLHSVNDFEMLNAPASGETLRLIPCLPNALRAS